MTMTTEEIQALQALADKVTKGPWLVEKGQFLIWGECNVDDTSSNGFGYPCATVHHVRHSWDHRKDDIPAEANAAFIAASREAVPALCAEVLALRAEVARLREAGAA